VAVAMDSVILGYSNKEPWDVGEQLGVEKES